MPEGEKELESERQRWGGSKGERNREKGRNGRWTAKVRRKGEVMSDEEKELEKGR